MTVRPNPLPWYYRWSTNLIQGPLFLVATALCGSAALLASFFDPGGRLQHRIAQIWARLSVLAAFCRVTVIGRQHLLAHPVAVYASNHTSYMDTPVVFSTLPFQFRILAKKDLWEIPFIGWYLRRSGQIPIDTANTRASLSSLGLGIKALRAGMPLFVFPEGGRTPTGRLQTFLGGAAYLAIRAQVPIVPIALVGVYSLLPIHTRHLYPNPLTLIASEPIPTAGLTLRQADELTARVRDAIARAIAEYGGATDLESTVYQANQGAIVESEPAAQG